MEYIILFLPLISSILSGFFGKQLGVKFSQHLSCVLIMISAIFSIVIFYFIITPIGILIRLLKLSKINKKYDSTLESYWIKKRRNINKLNEMLSQK